MADYVAEQAGAWGNNWAFILFLILILLILGFGFFMIGGCGV
ncbi:hypothetical protein ACOBQJ_05150 [Pelotomaculum propionicicum]